MSEKKQGELYRRIHEANTGSIEYDGNENPSNAPTQDYKFDEVLDEAKAERPFPKAIKYTGNLKKVYEAEELKNLRKYASDVHKWSLKWFGEK
jgi:hypothetical protein